MFVPLREVNANLIDAKKSRKEHGTKWKGKRKRSEATVIGLTKSV